MKSLTCKIQQAADDRRNSPSPGAELNALCAEIESDLKVTDDTTVAKADAGGPREPTLLEAEKVRKKHLHISKQMFGRVKHHENNKSVYHFE